MESVGTGDLIVLGDICGDVGVGGKVGGEGKVCWGWCKGGRGGRRGFWGMGVGYWGGGGGV